jgi:putative PIN family toxin of toxin-antitoxin system
VTNSLRYVLDTNVIVSALLVPDSVPGRAFFEARNRGDLLLSTQTIEEIAEVLRRPKFDRYVTHDEREHFLAKLIREAKLIEPLKRVHACRDPKDDRWLELAVAGDAQQIISGDRDLISLRQFRDISIVSPAQYLESLDQS